MPEQHAAARQRDGARQHCHERDGRPPEEGHVQPLAGQAAPLGWPGTHCEDVDAAESYVEQEEDEVLVVPEAHAVGHPGAVVVHAQHAPATHGAVVRTRRLRLLALVTPVLVQEPLLLTVAALLLGRRARWREDAHEVVERHVEYKPQGDGKVDHRDEVEVAAWHVVGQYRREVRERDHSNQSKGHHHANRAEDEGRLAEQCLRRKHHVEGAALPARVRQAMQRRVTALKAHMEERRPSRELAAASSVQADVCHCAALQAGRLLL
mmetsp:Transcript_19093/g.73463  ORF Transcript_19093/g.73463 Transcript_19093/m.73463 type:complete len:265 (+) Transcript_19093:1883-2677(+)